MSDRPSVVTRQTFAHLLPRGGPCEKYTRLLEHGEEHAAVGTSFQHSRQHLIGESRKAESYLRQCEEASLQQPPPRLNMIYNPPVGGDAGVQHYIPRSDKKHVLDDATARVDEAKAALARLDERIREHDARSTIAVVSRCNQWLRELPTGVRLEAAKLPDKLPKPTIEAVKMLRDELDRHKNALERVRSAPPPASALKAAVAREVERLAKPPTIHVAPGARQRLQPAVTLRSLQGEGSVALPDGGFQQVHTVATDNPVDVLGLIAWAFGDLLVKQLHSEIDRLLDGEDTTEPAERAKREAEALAAIDDIERREEALIEALESNGIVVTRRPDASPESILGVVPLGASSNRRAA